MIYREGSRDVAMNKAIQEVTGAPADGAFGPQTTRYVKTWQAANGLTPDGLVGPKTLELMGIISTDTVEQYYTTESGLLVQRYFLPKGEYLDRGKPVENDYAFLHHTAGGNNPFKCIDHWGRDSRGRVATEFVLGGQKVSNGDDTYDGVMAQAFPDGCQGWHLGNTGSRHMNTHSVALEICSFGYLDDEFKTYVGQQAIQSQVSKLEEPFRRKANWHKYSEKQIEATRKWILFIAERDNIDVRDGLIKWIREKGPIEAFGFNEDAHAGKIKGLLTHTNVRKDKMDNFPQPEFIDMLLTI
jgi:hypothetical protein